MVLANTGLNRIRDRTNSDIYKVQAGTGTTVPTTSDTDLQTAVADTQNDASTSTSDKQITVTNRILSTQGSGSTLTEGIIELGDVTTQYLLARFTYTGLTKPSTEEHSHITRVFFRNNN